MGLNSNQSANKQFLNIINGRIVKRATEDTPDAKMRHSEKLNKDIWELVFNSITGNIIGMKISGTEFGDVLEVEVQDVDEKFVLNIPCESRYFTSFCNKVKNINFVNELTIMPYSFDDKEKLNKKTGKPSKVTGLNIYQKGAGENDKVPNYFTRETKDEGQPTLPEKYTDAQLKIFFIELQEFNKKLISEYSNKIVSPKEVIAEMKNEVEVESEGILDDGLPF